MLKSESINDLAAALSKAQAQIKPALKNKTNPHFKSKYADLDACWDAARMPLSANGLSICQPISVDGKAVTITTILMHSSGQFLSEETKLYARDESPQAVGSVITYGRRYGFCGMVGVTADEDDDGNAAQPDKKTSKEVTRERGERAPPAPKPEPAKSFNPEDPSHRGALEAMLTKQKIDHPIMREEIMRKMAGRPREDLDRVIEDVMYPNDMLEGVFDPEGVAT